LPASATKNNESISDSKINPLSTNIPIHKVYLETSKAEQMAGINVSYDNSFNAIKRDIQVTVGRDHVPVKENLLSGLDFDSNRKVKNIGDDLPPNKPNEAIMISENVKVNERERRDSNTTPTNVRMSENQRNKIKDENQLNHTMPDEFNNSIENNHAWQKLSASRVKDHYDNINEHNTKHNTFKDSNQLSREVGVYKAARNTAKMSKIQHSYKVK